MNELNAYLNGGQVSISRLLLQEYRTLKMSTDELTVYLQLTDFASQGDQFPDLALIGERMQLPAKTIYELVHRLIQKKLITLESRENEQGQAVDRYDLTPTLMKLSILAMQAEQAVQADLDQNQRAMIFNQVEQLFGRPLSPLETEIIANWLDLDRYNPDLIQLAVREAVFNQVYSLKYVDRILLNWQKQNIKTKDDLQDYQQKHPRF
ncbi:DnaD domain protein [Latilactobacillus fuchuensis]|uniref:DNA replication protein DnaD (Primosomal protein DnaD) n=2 Tax=Latilactobacillus fuchuensis TaxID=164393 RepID=A0A2N9DVD3_9LACO|nr:DnaD domain protein [Latilactobacillus fuchuensis]KRL62099.1 dnaD protein [Latilactobacillus fuchuensis DSM 14340 = JCM 11249]MCP8856958.1 DnaD domain protein [Latilactobacillus fuchuensis]SPC38423.1 DNA replication protein DnaD (Primosomal protein DnaD) [Latilactobacillus fuchuensis]